MIPGGYDCTNVIDNSNKKSPVFKFKENKTFTLNNPLEEEKISIVNFTQNRVLAIAEYKEPKSQIKAHKLSSTSEALAFKEEKQTLMKPDITYFEIEKDKGDDLFLELGKLPENFKNRDSDKQQLAQSQNSGLQTHSTEELKRESKDKQLPEHYGHPASTSTGLKDSLLGNNQGRGGRASSNTVKDLGGEDSDYGSKSRLPNCCCQ